MEQPCPKWRFQWDLTERFSLLSTYFCSFHLWENSLSTRRRLLYILSLDVSKYSSLLSQFPGSFNYFVFLNRSEAPVFSNYSETSCQKESSAKNLWVKSVPKSWAFFLQTLFHEAPCSPHLYKNSSSQLLCLRIPGCLGSSVAWRSSPWGWDAWCKVGAFAVTWKNSSCSPAPWKKNAGAVQESGLGAVPVLCWALAGTRIGSTSPGHATFTFRNARAVRKQACSSSSARSTLCILACAVVKSGASQPFSQSPPLDHFVLGYYSLFWVKSMLERRSCSSRAAHWFPMLCACC